MNWSFFHEEWGRVPLFQVNYRIAVGLYLFSRHGDGSPKIPVAKFNRMLFQRRNLHRILDTVNVGCGDISGAVLSLTNLY